MGSDNMRREDTEKALPLADLAQAIERRQIPTLRHGDEYVLRATDVRKLRAQVTHEQEAMRSRETQRESLEMGRSA
jgi:hypothetical protein